MEATEQETPAIEHDVAEPDPVDPVLDLGLIERDLDGVAVALERLDAGTYWTDEVTGGPIADQRLLADPTARRAG